MQIGLVGLPNAGKTTLFNALTLGHAPVASYRFTTIQPNIGMATVPDDRVYAVGQTAGCERFVPATMKVMDVAGLVEGASRGEGLGNQFLAEIRAADALLHVVRGFSVPEEGAPHPAEDVRLIDTELALADLEMVGRRRSRIEKRAGSGDPDARAELALLERLESSLAAGSPVRSVHDIPDAAGEFRTADLLTAKPLVFVLSVDEPGSEIARSAAEELSSALVGEGGSMLVAAPLLETELAALAPEEEGELRAAYGLEYRLLEEVIQTGYRLLGLISFFTTESKEARAWEIVNGTRAIDAAACIHTDMAKGFIKAEVVRWNDLVDAGSWHRAREHGTVLIEGKDFIVRDGDVIRFVFRA